MKRILLLLIAAASIHAQTWGAWNGVTVGSSAGNISGWDGTTIGTVAGNISQWNTLNAPSSGLTVVGNGTHCYSGGSLTCTTSSISVKSGDQLYIFAYTATTVICSGVTWTFTDNQGSHETYTGQGLVVHNNFSGGQCASQWTVENVGTTNAAFTVTFTASNVGSASGDVGVSILQLRGSANATADQTACNDTSGPSGASVTIPAAGGTLCGSTAVTTNHIGIVVAGVSLLSGVTVAPGSCFGASATLPSGTNSAQGGIEYYILSTQPQTGTCGLSWTGGSATFIGQLATYH